MGQQEDIASIEPGGVDARDDYPTRAFQDDVIGHDVLRARQDNGAIALSRRHFNAPGKRGIYEMKDCPRQLHHTQHIRQRIRAAVLAKDWEVCGIVSLRLEI